MGWSLFAQVAIYAHLGFLGSCTIIRSMHVHMQSKQHEGQRGSGCHADNKGR